jgi:hypothetical protein
LSWHGNRGFPFVEEAVFGISASGSVRLTDIGRALEEKIPLHATHKRLSSNLADESLEDFELPQKLPKSWCRHIALKNKMYYLFRVYSSYRLRFIGKTLI